MVYRFRAGYSFDGITAQAMGDTLAAIAGANAGRIIPSVVVEESRPEEAPLHAGFTWDDAVAAEMHREDEARRMIRSYVVVRQDHRGRDVEEIANVSVARPFDADGPAYMPARQAMEDPDLRARIVAYAQRQLEGWEARYGHLQELAHVVAAIREARAEAPPEAPRPRRGARRRLPVNAPAVAPM